ncbi:MAG: family 78 glycoside hydrolase catalytic domain [Kiritimatiellae bacterium]|jgi:hypothetical protein|nr:family 78 glycoside hydrolase catalytic domain [Kiritimatiellia bacterium]
MSQVSLSWAGVLLFSALLYSGAGSSVSGRWVNPIGVDNSHPYLLTQSEWLRVDEPVSEHLKAKEKKPEKMKIISAVYGTQNDSQFKDVKQIIEDNILRNNGFLKLTVSNSILTDPAYGMGKRLKVIYSIAGEELTEVQREGGFMQLPKNKPDYRPNRPKMIAAPRYLRRDFKIVKTPVKAYLYAAALGLCELRLNGIRIAHTFPQQESLNYTNSVPVHCYNISSFIRKGDNTVAVILSNGRYSGFINSSPSQICAFGYEPHLRAQIEIRFADGSTQVVGTDHKWQGCYQGPLVYSGTSEGEIYDAGKEMPGWDKSGYQPGPLWESALINRSVEVGDFTSEIKNNVSIAGRKNAVMVGMPSPGIYVFDLGESVIGYPELLVDGVRGQNISIHCHLSLNNDGTVFKEKLEKIENSTGQNRFLQYKLNVSGKICLTPRFYCWKFRYIEVAGLRKKPDKNALKAVVMKIRD